MKSLQPFGALLIVLCCSASCIAADPSPQGTQNPRGPVASTWEQVFARMHPWSGQRHPGSDPSTLHGKIMCGYQGWFAAEGDGSGVGWIHFGQGIFKPGNCFVDLWPEMSDFPADERYPTSFHHADGSSATVFSSYNPKTVNRHFEWMAQYGIDGVFLQRFGTDMRKPDSYDFCDAILDNVRDAANAHGCTWAIMYDLSSLSPEELTSVILRDWKNLVDRMQIRNDPSYQKVGGKPLVSIWGVGFCEGRKYSLKDCERLIDFLKNDPKYGGNSIMLGVPYGWRELTRDSVSDPYLHALIQKADVVSPWAVTRYRTSKSFLEDLSIYQKPDMDWCREHRLDYLPVIFPGFSWVNLLKSRNQDGGPHFIPREKGSFFWTQGSQLIRAGAETIYVAMFDELDEGTAILKCSDNPPVGASHFQSEPGVPADHYLWLTGQLKQVLLKQLPFSEKPPIRPAGALNVANPAPTQ